MVVVETLADLAGSLANSPTDDMKGSVETQYYDEVLRLARRAAARGEVPVGAIVVDTAGQVIGRGYNLTSALKDGLQHAELRAIRQAQKHAGDWRLEGTTLYVTLEPCLMCLGAIGNARIRKVVYWLADPMFGSLESKLTRGQVKKIFPKLISKKLKDDRRVTDLMQAFFRRLRKG